MVLAGVYLYLSPQLDSVESIKTIKLHVPLRVYTDDGKLIGEFGEKRSKPIKFEDIPQDFLDALLAAEDADFYSHHGVSIKGLMRAVSHLLMTGEKGPGGSTLTMQLTRNVFLTLQQTFTRKFKEILMALEIERTLSKEQILELYVNLMFLGKRAYGIEAAAEVYYGKSVVELNLAQHAMIVGIFKGPSVLNPIANPKRALERRNYILGRMLSLKMINQERYTAMASLPITAKYHGQNLELHAPYIAELARKEALKRYGKRAYSDGYSVFTSVKSHMQESAQQAVIEGLLSYTQRHGYRGPEQRLAFNTGQKSTEQANQNPNTPEDTTPPRLSEQDRKQWLKRLKNIPTYAELKPAAVTQVGDQQVTVLIASGEEIVIPWGSGLSEARAYISEDKRGPSPKTASEVLTAGDVIRIRNTKEKSWTLSQLPQAQAALVALSVNDGAILSLVGGFDYRHSKFNRVTQSERQPGSNFKPFIYTSALESGLTPATIFNDAPIVFDDAQLESTWRPENYSGKFQGPTRLRKALYQSRNLVSIRLLRRIGIKNAIKTLEKFGFDPATLPKDLSLSLGTHAVTPLQVATGYAVFANGGYKINPYLITRIENFRGDIIYRAKPNTVCADCNNKLAAYDEHYEITLAAQRDQTPDLNNTDPYDAYIITGDPFKLAFELKDKLGILSPGDFPRAAKILDDQVAYLMDSILKDVIIRGTGRRARALNRNDLAGKTGTTNGPVDAWFSGYNQDIAASAWVGFDQNYLLGKREAGGTAALPIWIDFMRTALRSSEDKQRTQPTGLVTVRINPETGKRAPIGDPNAIFELFRAENLPEQELQHNASPWQTEGNAEDDLF